MQYKRLGNSGALVSELALGTMTFGKGTSEEESIRMMHQFLDEGGNFIDTADTYVGGKSEEIVGKALKDRRSEVVLATKVRMKVGETPNDVGYSRKRVMDGVEQSLRRLKTDYIDLYQLHVWDHLTPIEETLRTLDDLIRSGKVRYIGCSNFLAWQLMKSLSVSERKQYAPFITIQSQYSLLHRELDREVLSLCNEEGIGLLPWAPLGGGFLTGKYSSFQRPNENWRLATAGPGEYVWENKALKRNFVILEKVKEIANDIGKTPAQVSLNWLLETKGVTAPIFGARTLEQYEENMGAIGWSLSEEHKNQLEEVSALPPEYPNRFIEKFRRQL
ncbi:aryl-alcohol dehydrogenase-like predicted oxidoreductase [Salibacterium salarium]|uniref:aldo/keto reductase n=1 Tax=Salibacterium salarium TaxID=284579 RepID=UPI00278112D9|nr:aldo/keto reductase [Salibacterium salarium]MDQ0299319.1 aryl-alcohol dehydrogenase-like predicted oxidoreductase [Salibacterium salarium]